MREIKFRGKRLDNGEWVHGDYHFRAGGERCIIVMRPNEYGKVVYEVNQVDPSTVGQFTGLYDEEGHAIYEGDVVYVAGVGNTEAVFPFQDIYEAKTHTDYCCDVGRVIGNIHDNPELIK